ncbi:MAG: TcpQ domain-containing protein [Alphaproteobacteria bacterium]
MLLSTAKKQLLKCRTFAVLFLLFLTASCAGPLGWPWQNVSSYQVPDYTQSPMANVVPQGELGERAPADHLVSDNDVGATYGSSLPPGYPQPMNGYLPDQVFGEESLNGDQMAALGYQENPQNGDAVEDFADPVEDWLVQEGATLKQLLSDWSDRSGWRLVWKSKRDFKIEAGAMLRGRYVDVASAVIRNMARARPAPMATFFRGNRVLLIETLEDENAY